MLRVLMVIMGIVLFLPETIMVSVGFYYNVLVSICGILRCEWEPEEHR